MALAEETQLIAQAQAGDVDAFCLLVSRHQRHMYALAYRFCGDHHDAEDLVQEALMNAYRAIGQFKGLASFQTWLRRIMLNAFLNHKRKNEPRAAQDVTADSTYSIAGSERVTFNKVVVEQVLQRLAKLPARQRLIFVMKHQEGLTCEEIAEQFEITVGTVKKTLFRIVHQLRQEFRTPVKVVDEAKRCTIVRNSVKS